MLLNKLVNVNIPFLSRVLGKDPQAVRMFISSIYSRKKTSIFRSIAFELAKDNFHNVKYKHILGDNICKSALNEIGNTINRISWGARPNKLSKIESIKNSIIGNVISFNSVKVDLYLEHNGEIFLFLINTAEPNIGNFKDFKRTLLEWVGITLSQNKEAKVNTLIAVPYNPYEPQPYQRWTMNGMLDLPNEVKVAEEFWNFLGGDGAYEDLLDCFELAGLELKDEINNHFRQFI